ncbi:MAG TPA: hypothetical protein VM286_04340 [Candidatus Thermoplasmatota archaeon]|nr:hypothetical protein [Candidatus Thermoplasmatota archaeon]
MSAGPWPVLLLLILVNLIVNLATGTPVSTLTITEVVVLVTSLVVYVGLIGSGGSDVLGIGETAVGVARQLALVAFIAAVVALAVTNSVLVDNLLVGFVDLALGGFAVFQAISIAKPGAA